MTQPLTSETLSQSPQNRPSTQRVYPQDVGAEVIFPLKCKVIRHMTNDDGSVPMYKLQAVSDDPAFRSFAVPVDAVDPVK